MFFGLNPRIRPKNPISRMIQNFGPTEARILTEAPILSTSTITVETGVSRFPSALGVTFSRRENRTRGRSRRH
ncbi:MAG: hypothetical protein CMF59_05855 [Leptospiraceae bacterium]|nr:hypothetical protein [Leptospiraceae bacterium]